MSDQENLRKLLLNINIAIGHAQVKELEEQGLVLLEGRPELLLDFYEHEDRMSPIVLESVVSLAGHFSQVVKDNKGFLALLEKCSMHSRGWVRTKAMSYLAPSLVSVDAFRDGDRIFRNKIKTDFDVSSEIFEQRDDVELLCYKNTEWGDSLILKFEHEAHSGIYLFLTKVMEGQEASVRPFRWLSMGGLFKNDLKQSARLWDALQEAQKYCDRDAVYEDVAKVLSEMSQEEMWLFHVEGDEFSKRFPRLHVRPSQI